MRNILKTIHFIQKNIIIIYWAIFLPNIAIAAKAMPSAFLGQELSMIEDLSLPEGNLYIQFTSTVTDVSGINVTLSQITRDTQQIERIHRVSDKNGNAFYENLKTGSGFGYMLQYELPSQTILQMKPFQLEEKKGFRAKIPVFPISENDSKLSVSVQYVLEFRETGLNGSAFFDLTNRSTNVIVSKKQKWIFPLPTQTSQVKLSEQSLGVILRSDNTIEIDSPISPRQTRTIEFSFFIPLDKSEFTFKHDIPFRISEQRIVLQALNHLDLSQNEFASSKPLKHQNQHFIDIRPKIKEPQSVSLHLAHLPYQTETPLMVIMTFVLGILACIVILLVRLDSKQDNNAEQDLLQHKESLLLKLKNMQSNGKTESDEYKQTLQKLSRVLYFIDNQKIT